MVSATLIGDIKDVLNKGSFREFSISFDGTPAFAEAEAIIIRVVTKDYHILELLVKCNLFKKKLDHEQLANHLVKAIVERLEKKLKDWIAAQQDRANTNKAALTVIEEKFDDAKLPRNYCCLYTLSNSGK